MDNLGKSILRFFSPVKPLPEGMYHYQAPADDPRNYRLHLRLEPGGKGMLVVNASTILHMNQTAAEYAYHLIQKTPEQVVARSVAKRYKVPVHQALFDFLELKETIDLLISRDDIDPEIFLDMESTQYEKLSFPLRLDCALTYRLPEGVDPAYSPARRVHTELGTHEWKLILDKAWKDYIPHIIFTGGEPTMREDLVELIQHAENNGQVTGLLSDGQKLADPAYFNQLLTSGLDHLLFLLQPEKDQSWHILETALKADLAVVTHVTLTPRNVNQINSTLERLASLQGHYLSLSGSDSAIHESLTAAYEKAAQLDLNLVWDLPVPFSEFNPIAITQQPDDPTKHSRKSWLYIEPDGDILTSQESETVLGNVLKDPIGILWNQISS
jgi:organic radical activating enzyme